MVSRKAFPIRPIGIRHDFGKFAGELCPICRQNKLVAVLEYPVCMRCRHKYGITKDLLKPLKAHRLLISQEIIDWQQQPHPVIEGTIDDASWKAWFVMGGWLVEILGQADDRIVLAALIKQYLDSVTPAWLDRVKERQTKIRRYCFMVAIGATVATTAYFLKKRAERRKKELREAEEAEGKS